MARRKGINIVERIRHFLFVIFSVILMVACSGENQNHLSFKPENVPLLSPADVYPYALEEATLWYEDPFLYDVMIDLDLRIIAYLFQPSQKANRYLIVYAFLAGNDLELEAKESESNDFHEYKHEIVFQDIITIEEAYRIAYEAGGEHFFSISSDNSPEVRMSINQIRSKEPLVWSISFVDDELGNLVVSLDAYTGDVLQVIMSDAFKGQ
jgi:hypothetical protein